MDPLTHFIAETPLWLTIIFLAVFAAMWIWFFVLLVQASGEVRSLGSSGPFDYEGSDEDYEGPVR